MKKEKKRKEKGKRRETNIQKEWRRRDREIERYRKENRKLELSKEHTKDNISNNNNSLLHL